MADTRIPRDLPFPIWALFPPLMILVLAVLAYTDSHLFQKMLAKDAEGGWVEIMTVLVLLPGIFAGTVTLLYHREKLRRRWLALWILVWTLASVYFAGEEISWGQWIFRYETPEIFKALNDQQETNLHNISSWLDQKPRALVELWIVVAGFLLPLIRWRRGGSGAAPDPRDVRGGLFPTRVCVPSAALMLFVRIADWIEWRHVHQFKSSELREYYIALFMSIYLLSFWFRLRRTANR